LSKALDCTEKICYNVLAQNVTKMQKFKTDVLQINDFGGKK
jgi:hypothetical protein